MSVTTMGYDLTSIGVVSGLIWHYLSTHGPVTLSRLAKEIAAPRDMVMQGVGWLAREGKLTFVETPRATLVGINSEH